MAQEVSLASQEKQNQIEQAKWQAVLQAQEAGTKHTVKRDDKDLDKVMNHPDKQPRELQYNIKSLTDKQAKINEKYQAKKQIRKQQESQSDIKVLDKVKNHPNKQPRALNFSIKSLTDKQATINKEYQDKKPIRTQQQDMHRLK